MRHKLLHENAGQRTFVVVLDRGDEVMASLLAFAEGQGISAAQFTAIGALSDVVLQYFDWAKKDYVGIPVHEQVEVASLIGDVALAPTGKPALHVHLVIGKSDGSAMAGHLGEGHVRPTLEVVLTESPAHLHKVKDPVSGLALIDPQITQR
jgi:predicted DNA-binding protein with PD1-like motif